MNRAATLAQFLWDFVVGDDWRVFVAVVAALGASAILSDAGVPCWWLLPAVVVAILALSVLTVERRRAEQH